MNKTFRAVLFDLDGTLADTLADLSTAANHALITLGCPPHPLDAYRHFVGDGARVLCERALPAGRVELVEPALRLMREHYSHHWHDQTQPYPGITELVSALTERRYRLAVLSNKPDEFTKQMVAHYFGEPTPNPSKEGNNKILLHSKQGNSEISLPSYGGAGGGSGSVGPFQIVRGQMPGVPLKPDPTSARQIANDLGVSPSEWLYLGDTNTDMRTAVAAGMYPVGVLWGFRDKKELLDAGAQTLLTTPSELLKLLSERG